MRNRTSFGPKERSKILKKVSERYYNLQNTNPPFKLHNVHSFAWHMLDGDRERICALTPVIQKEIAMGLADIDEKGYVPITIYQDKDLSLSWDDIADECDWLNKNVLGWSVEESAEIVLSSFRR